MNIVSKIIKRIKLATTGKLILKKEVSRLQNDSDPACRSLANVFNGVIKNERTDEEKNWVKKIEALRKDLLSSTNNVSITDYGAGSPDSNLTDDNMYKGKVIVKTVGDVCRWASKPYKWDLLLFKLVREFRPSVCVELGTCLGISASYQAAACELNNNGMVFTLEGAEELVALSRANLAKLGIKRATVVSGRFQDTLQSTLDKNSTLDYVFIDGHHEEKATLAYYKQILPRLSEGSIIVFDDIAWSKGMQRAWKTLQNEKNLKISVDLTSMGVCVFTKSPNGANKHFKVAI
jgi:predicted O-methyltransferase YrrM